jgi:hypothetical protein
MATLSRLAFAFGAPATLMATAIGVVWLSTSRLDTVSGPGRPVAFTPPTELASTVRVEGVDPPAPPPNVDEPTPAWQAQARNALIPYSRVRLLSPARFSAASDPESPAQALQCLTSAIYYEANGEPDAGKRAVAQVVINRWAHRAFPKTICAVIDQGAPTPGCQFSFMCDGSLAKRPSPPAWRDAESIARAALNGYVETSVGGATHYHADYVVPVWAATMLKLTKLGRHIFYRWPGEAAYMTLRPVDPVASASASAPEVSGGAPPQLTALSPANAPAAPARAQSSSARDDTPRRDLETTALAATPRPQPPAPSPPPLAGPTPTPRSKPEPPRRPVPPPSLRFGPV